MSRHLRRACVRIAIAIGLAAAVSPPRLVAGAQPSAIERALGFLLSQQIAALVDVTVNGTRVLDFPGDWPQQFSVPGGGGLVVRDVSPFTAAFIHHALTTIVPFDRRSLGATDVDLLAAHVMRRRAVRFMKGFASPTGAADAGTFGFWPYDIDPATPDPLLTLVLTAELRGPILGGRRVPINFPIYPSTLAIPSDADVTATTYAALLDDALWDGGTSSGVPFERFFVDWRDTGAVPRRLNPWWLPPASGAFLTWLTYRDQPFPRFPNDVDLVVNANVLYALGRYQRLAVPGAAEAAGLINLAVALGLHRGHLQEISNYYPDNFAFQYAVTRAYREGHVAALAPAVGVIAADLEAAARVRADGAVYWDHGAPQLNTAFAVLALLNAGRRGVLVDRAIDFLASEQNALGGFDEATFFVARTDGGQVSEFSSASFTTAMALEAFARHELAAVDRR